MLRIPAFLPDPSNHAELLDWVDKLSFGFTCTLLVTFSFASAGSLFVGSPIECMPPANTPGAWGSYYTQYCFVQPHSFVPTSLQGSDKHTVRQISFYPWVPFVLMTQAVMFYLPKFFWESTACKFGIDVKSIVYEIKSVQNKARDVYYNTLREIAVYMSAYLDYIYGHGQPKWFILSSPTTLFFLAKKWLFFLNALIQFVLICEFVGGGDYGWGFEAVVVSLREMSLIKSPVFPLMTYCSVPYVVDNVNEKRNMPCLLGMNIVFEKIYVFLYFWTLFMCFFTLAHAIFVTVRLCVPKRRMLKVASHLNTSGFKFHEDAVHRFLNDVLRADGLLALLMIEEAFGDIPMQFLVREIWLYTKSEDSIVKPKMFDELSEMKAPLVQSTPK